MNSELLSIKGQLVGNKPLLQSEREFLLDAITRHENGDSWEDIFQDKEPEKKPVGKNSPAYRRRERVRNIRLGIALTYFEGSDWDRCQQLAEVTNRVIRETNAGRFRPETEPERILERIKKSGVKMLTTGRNIYRVLFTDKSSPL